jgi:hypothetical protein
MNIIAKAISVALIAAPLAMAAEAFSLGGHASVAYSSFWNGKNDLINMNKFWGPGFNVGLAGYMPFNSIIGFNPEISFGYRYESYEQKISDEDGKEKNDYSIHQENIDIPLLFRINVMQQGLFFEAGPFISFDLDADTKNKYTDTYTEEGASYSESGTAKLDLDQNVFEFGLIGGAGYSITNKIDVDLRFALGLTKLYDEDEVPAKSFMFHLGGTYWFM